MKFTKSAMKRSVLLDPGWTKLRFVKMEEKAAKKGNSFNNIFHFTSVNEEDQKQDGVPVDILLNDAMEAPLVKLAVAFGADLDPEEGGDFEFKDVEEGIVIWADIFQSEYNNQIKNDANNFLHIDEEPE